MSMETPTKNRSQQALMYDESEHTRQLSEMTDTSSNDKINQLTSLADGFFSELHLQQQDDPRRSSANDVTTIFDRSQLWNNISSASVFCATTTDRASTCSLRNTYYPYRQPLITQSDLAAPSVQSPSAMEIMISRRNDTNEHQRSSSLSLSANTTIDYQYYFPKRLSKMRLSSTALAGSHDRIADNIIKIGPIVPQILPNVIGQPSGIPRLFPRNIPTIKTKTNSFCYLPTFDPFFSSN